MKAFLRNLVAERQPSPSSDVSSASPRIEHEASSLPFRGFDVDRVNSGFVEFLSDDDLARLNEMLPWKCFTADSVGRRFGNSAWKGKRDTPQQIPDQRIVQMNTLFNLKNRSVLEVGCFEGIHTIGIAQCGAKVYAIDSRVENVVKTIVRTSMFGYTPQVFVCNLEEDSDVARLPVVDFVHHVGVLYHLKDPVSHLLKLANIAKDGLLLDTHYASSEMVNSCYAVNGKEYRYFGYREKGRNEVFSGMYDHAKWLLLDDIKELLGQIGFSDIRISKDFQQRNGPRVTLFAARPSIIIAKNKLNDDI
ncbi:MAG: class I SAM-dependent methyltransferase [Nitrospira sp.]|nr:class I SAM-dependent methyltransferase [Nitrospira sp.]MDH4368983.1 class I SAM-dependent methyltransferase [Nitrospira sp.]MDH5347127.1 class I SAM-dependent methyltransferase [Nitrospira sp.]MDH5496540.1 class I SAM-dependent methyltransferase [Nitrospira sp.]MDH5726785.1 class I SAM-dependent methyltransferase [Nitrospira sp.]